MAELAIPDGKILDVSRLLSRLRRDTPTGIDRVELAYARNLIKSDANIGFSVTTPVNTGLLPDRVARRVMQAADERWSPSADDPATKQAIQEIAERLRAPVTSDVRHQPIRVKAEDDRAAGLARSAIWRAYAAATAARLLNPRQREIRSTATWYIHVSHMNLHKPARLRWIRPGAPRCLFMVHDLIPLSHPEHFLPGEDARHRMRMETVARLADIVIFNSAATKSAWNDFVAESGLPAPRGEVVPLGLEEEFLKPAQAPAFSTSIPYFVVLGTLESRKNLSFLLHVWKQRMEQGASPQARMVIVGRRSRHSENVVDLIDRSVVLAPSLMEISALPDAGLAVLLRGAQALLAPSLIEGFGLPIAEALALGVPVIASDIAAHREVGGPFAEYLDPIDGHAWRQALTEYSDPNSERRKQRIHAIADYRPMSWPDHIGRVQTLLGTPINTSQ